MYLQGFFWATEAATAALRKQGIVASLRYSTTNRHQPAKVGEEGDLFTSCFAEGEFVLIEEGDLRYPNLYGLRGE